MTVFWTADLHFSHARISEFCERPFTNVDDMDEGLIDRWNAQVSLEDDVWVLGDVAMGKIDESLPLVGFLNGTKYLLTGNHDRCWPHHGKKADGWEQKYREAGFDMIFHDSHRIPLGVGGGKVLANHFPYAGDSGEVDRYVDQRPVDKGDWLLHGHVHDTWLQRGRQINVGIDAWGGRLASSEDILALVHAGPRALPAYKLDCWRSKDTRMADMTPEEKFEDRCSIAASFIEAILDMVEYVDGEPQPLGRLDYYDLKNIQQAYWALRP